MNEEYDNFLGIEVEFDDGLQVETYLNQKYQIY
jgi:hypothetical protein